MDAVGGWVGGLGVTMCVAVDAGVAVVAVLPAHMPPSPTH